MVVKDACANQTRYEPAIHCFLGKKNELTEIYKVLLKINRAICRGALLKILIHNEGEGKTNAMSNIYK